MQIKVIATDLDGTLLHNKYSISKKNIIALKTFIKCGGIVCFVTGRSLASTKEIADFFENKTGYKIKYLSCLKGSVLYDNQENKIIYQKTIHSDCVDNIFKLSKKYSCSFSAYLERDINNKNMVIFGNNFICNFLHFFNKFKNFIKIDNFEKKNKVFKININKILNLKKLKLLSNEILKKYQNKIDMSFTSKFLYEITDKNCNKGISIKKISKLLNINLNQFAAFGDSDNDIEIFNEVGLSIAIGNHCKKISQIANYQFKYDKKNGVAKGINKYIFNKS